MYYKKGAFSWYIALSQLITSGVTRETVRHGDARDWPRCAVVAISPDFAKNSTPTGFLALWLLGWAFHPLKPKCHDVLNDARMTARLGPCYKIRRISRE